MSQLKLITDFVPIDITTAEGYKEFIKSPLCSESSTIFPDDNSEGYVLVQNEVVATVSPQVKDSLFSYCNYPLFQNDVSSQVPTGMPQTPRQEITEMLSSPESLFLKSP